MPDFEQVRQAKTIHQDTLLKRANVVGVGVGYKISRRSPTGELSLVVLVRQKLPPAALTAGALVPPELAGVRTDVIEVGELRALSQGVMARGEMKLAGFTTRRRPAPPGVSIGHYRITAGTLGCVVRERSTGRKMILSNNHVLANVNQARPGDPILQPGPADGGELGPDTIALLDRFIPLRFNAQPATCDIARAYARFGNLVARLAGSGHHIQAVKLLPGALNQVDAALARPLDEADLLDRTLEIGPVYGVRPASLGLAVCKSGRTTAFTTGDILVTDAAVVVSYGPGWNASFDGQVITTPMSQGGDSGSLVATVAGHQSVGLLFAGSQQATIFTPIQTVLDALRVDLPGSSARAAPGLGTHNASTVEHAQAVRQVHQARLLSKANVVGVGIGLRHRNGQRTDQLGLVVLVERKLPPEHISPDDLLPSEIDGVPVDVRGAGRFKP